MHPSEGRLAVYQRPKTKDLSNTRWVEGASDTIVNEQGLYFRGKKKIAVRSVSKKQRLHSDTVSGKN